MLCHALGGKGCGCGAEQGNWGNALMAYGILKKRYISELRQAPPPRTYEERAAARATEDQLIGAALTVFHNVPYSPRLPRPVQWHAIQTPFQQNEGFIWSTV